MKRFKNILVLADKEKGIKQIIKRASDLAQENKARLTIIDVQEDYSEDIIDIVSVTKLAQIQRDSTKLKLNRLIKIWESSKHSQVKARIKVLTGTPFIEIIKEILIGKYDLLIKLAEEESGLKTKLFGTTDMHLMRKCPCPLWIIKPTRKRKYHRIMAAVNPENEKFDKSDLNIKIMDLATSLAKEDNSELHIIHTWNFFDEITLRGRRMNMPKDQAVGLINSVETLQKNKLDNLISGYNLKNIKHKVHLLRGKPSLLIPSAALRNIIDLIVMGTLARSGVAGMFIGNTAEEVLNSVSTSVLTVKPDDFQTPVTID